MKIIGPMQAILAIMILIMTTIIGFIPVLIIGFLKLIPYPRWQAYCVKAIDYIVTAWCGTNNFYINHVQRIQLDITGLENITPNHWHLVVANHQSWLDIVILQRVFNRKIPVLKFFIKDQLKWVPLLGFSWWAMGCPFMKRYSKEYLARNPHKQGKDLQSTLKAVETFRKTPASIMNFLEGTRFTDKKKMQQKSPYNHLLKPKTGGISFIISSMGQHITSLLDVTIVYPEKRHSLWDFLCQRVRSAKIVIKEIPIPVQFISKQLIEDTTVHDEFKTWLNQQWAEKDLLISTLK